MSDNIRISNIHVIPTFFYTDLARVFLHRVKKKPQQAADIDEGPEVLVGRSNIGK